MSKTIPCPICNKRVKITAPCKHIRIEHRFEGIDYWVLGMYSCIELTKNPYFSKSKHSVQDDITG